MIRRINSIVWKYIGVGICDWCEGSGLRLYSPRMVELSQRDYDRQLCLTCAGSFKPEETTKVERPPRKG